MLRLKRRKRGVWFSLSSDFNPIQSGVFEKVNDPGGGALNAHPPPLPTLSKTSLTIVTISCMSILAGVSRMFQLEFFLNSRF